MWLTWGFSGHLVGWHPFMLHVQHELRLQKTLKKTPQDGAQERPLVVFNPIQQGQIPPGFQADQVEPRSHLGPDTSWSPLLLKMHLSAHFKTILIVIFLFVCLDSSLFDSWIPAQAYLSYPFRFRGVSSGAPLSSQSKNVHMPCTDMCFQGLNNNHR